MSKSRSKTTAVGSLLLITLIAFPMLAVYTMPLAHAQGVSDLDRLLKDFFCTCGCNYVLATCETQMTCDVAKSTKSELRDMLAKGMTRDQIVEAMTAKYGNTVLATPRTTGFNTFLWWYPVAGGLVGLAAFAILIRRRNTMKWRVDPDAVPALSEEELLQQLDIDQDKVETSTERRYDDFLKAKVSGKEAEDITAEEQTTKKPKDSDGDNVSQQGTAEKKRTTEKDYDALLKEKTKAKKSSNS